MENTAKTPLSLALFLGITSVLFYLLATLTSISFQWNYWMFTQVGWLMSLSIGILYSYLPDLRQNRLSTLGSLFVFCAGLIHSMMTTIQAANLMWYRNHPDFPQETMQAIFTCQLGIDYAFDLFIATGTFFYGLRWASHTYRIEKITGFLGMITGILGYLSNTLSFPANPGEAGWVDPGPFFGGWFILFIGVIGYRHLIVKKDFR